MWVARGTDRAGAGQTLSQEVTSDWTGDRAVLVPTIAHKCLLTAVWSCSTPFVPDWLSLGSIAVFVIERCSRSDRKLGRGVLLSYDEYYPTYKLQQGEATVN